MPQGPVVAFTVSMASAVSLSSLVDLGKAWGSIMLEVPTMTSGSDVKLHLSADTIQTSTSAPSTFRPLYFTPTTGTPTVFSVASSITQAFIPIPNFRGRYVKVNLTTQTTDTGYVFRFLCAD